MVIILTKILSENWFSNYTYSDRYQLTGIDKMVVEYTKRLQANQVTIIDVGCSTAIALKKLRDTLKEIGIDSYIIGIDVDKKVKEHAEKNVDLFINADVTKITHLNNIADIVICSKMALWVSAFRRYEIVIKCSDFLKKIGILITDIDDYTQSRILEEFKDISQYDIPPLWILRKGLRKFLSEYRYRLHGHFRKMTKQFDKENAVKYAEQIIKGWTKLRWDQKFTIKFNILMFTIGQKLFPNKPKNQTDSENIKDGLGSYDEAFKKEFWTRENPRTKNIRSVSVRKDGLNQKVERLNGIVRDREFVMRGMDHAESAQKLVDAFRIHYNFVRNHNSIKKTPAEQAGIKLDLGKNKIENLIKLATKMQKIN